MIANWTVENNLLRGLPASHAPSPAALSAPGRHAPAHLTVCWTHASLSNNPGDIQLFTQSLIIMYLYLNWILNEEIHFPSLLFKEYACMQSVEQSIFT